MNIDSFLEEALPRVSKPTRYLGNEHNSVLKDKEQVKVHMALAFPDVYEVGMSHLGIKILYHLLNGHEDLYAERVFAPWTDFEELLRKNHVPLFTLESRTLLKELDFIGFTLQYEMSYTNILNMLELSQIPIFSKDRTHHPFIIAGGPCAFNPEPLADIIDFFIIGEAEDAIIEVLDLYKGFRKKDTDRQSFLKRVAQIPGVYVPSLYEVTYNDDGTIKEFIPKIDGVPKKVKKRFIASLDDVYYPKDFIVPYMKTVHDRAMLEIFRGCTHGCRFCQAGMIYRPVREKSVQRLHKLAIDIIKSTGFGELSLASLSTSDYSQLRQLVELLTEDFRDLQVALSLPSQRIDAFSLELAKKVQEVRKTGLTFAPEAGTQRLRDVINKGVTADDLLSSVKDAFSSGWKTIKLYFMIGLPTETYEDLKGIADLAYQVVDVYRKVHGNTRGLRINVSTSTFVPKPHTPFQWEPQISLSEIEDRQKFLKGLFKRSKNISYSWHDGQLSFLEAVFSRGDRRLGNVLKIAQEKGCKFDGWNELFSYEKWMDVFVEAGISPEFYAYKKRTREELFPWDIIDPGISKGFLQRELDKAGRAETTEDCRLHCHGCGVQSLGGWGL